MHTDKSKEGGWAIPASPNLVMVEVAGDLCRSVVALGGASSALLRFNVEPSDLRTKSTENPHRSQNHTNVIGTTMSTSETPQFLATLAEAVEDISIPVLAGGTFFLCILLHFIFGVLFKVSSKQSKNSKRMKKKRMSSLFRAAENDAGYENTD